MPDHDVQLFNDSFLTFRKDLADSFLIGSSKINDNIVILNSH